MVLFTMLVKFLCADFPFSAELQALGMGFQGAMAVRNGPNRDGRMHFFHAFALSTILGFGGGWMGFIWMGRPTSMITNGDVNITACIIAFAIANYTPNDIGFRLGNSLPVIIVTTVFSQLFRCMGLVKFISVAFNEVPPSPYYPIPVLGPILYGTMLGNMGSFLIKGFDGHLRGGIPWPFQNGIFIGTFFHLFAHDVNGPLGTILRGLVSLTGARLLMGGLDDRTFAIVVTSAFMQYAGIIMLPHFYGPTFSPVFAPLMWVLRYYYRRSKTRRENTAAAVGENIKERSNKDTDKNTKTDKIDGKSEAESVDGKKTQ